MDGWQVAQNYLGFAVLAGGVGGYYYYTHKQRQPTGARRQSSNEPRGKENRTSNIQRGSDDAVASSAKGAQKSDAASARKRKAPKKQQQPEESKPTPQVIVENNKPERESDLSVAQFAQQMTKARQGQKLAAPKSKDNRVRTVKQSSAQGTPIVSSDGEAGTEADDDLSPTLSSAANAGDVSDMLEPKASGPTSLRLVAPLKQQKERKPKQQKEEVVEGKKARQNRKKVEERRVQREEEEKARKALEERQRRAAREARGEPAKNGIPVPKAPLNNPWEQKNASTAATVQTGAPAVSSNQNGPLLDTFDAESTGSSTGGRASTAATSTTEGGNAQWENEEAQMAKAVKESEDESGWTTVNMPKKQQKKKGETSGEATPQEKPRIASPVKPVFTHTAKSTGFSALNADNPEDWEA